jgi:ABC-type spermidine/putrescine transport system permease subunit II
MFLPVAVVVLLSFNASQFGAFPMTGLSLRWFGRCGRQRGGDARLPGVPSCSAS